MFLGHFGVAFAAKKVAPATSLATLVLSAQLVDLLWPIFLLFGLEHVRIDPESTAVTPLDFYNYPFTHSLLGAVLWSAGAGLIYRVARRDWRGAWVVSGVVLSHWILDAVAHKPDLPLYPGSAVFIGLGLWNSVPATIGVELLLFGGGLALYLHQTRAATKQGSVALWSLVSFLFILWLSNLLGPPPPSEAMIGYAGLAMWLFIPWAMWIEQHRASTHPTDSSAT